MRIFLVAVLVACGGGHGAAPPPDTGSGGGKGDGPGTASDGSVDSALPAMPYQLTHPTGTNSDQNACFSPDGTFVIFTRFVNGYNNGPGHLYRIDASGGTPVQLSDGDQDDVDVPWGCFDRSNGKVIFASDRGDANDLWEMDPTPGATMTRLTNHGATPIWQEPVIAPGGEIAFESDLDVTDDSAQRAAVWVLQPGSPPFQMSNLDGHDDDRLPSFSPDGLKLVYQHRVPPSDAFHAVLMPAGGGTGTDLTALGPGPLASDREDTDLSWLPSGTYVLTSSNYGDLPEAKIFALPIEGGTPIEIPSPTPHEEDAPCSSPDGTHVAFETHHGENAPSAIWVVPTPALP